MRRILFYLRYASRNILRGGRWTTLAILCIAAGVATIVAMRGLGLAIAESLLTDVRADVKGDVYIVKGGRDADQLFYVAPDDVVTFSQREIDTVQAYVDSVGGATAEYTIAGNLQVLATESSTNSITTRVMSQFVKIIFIDPETYPPSHTITALDPADVPLSDLFTGGAQIVISETMAVNQDLSIGDTVSVARTEQEFEVIGIVAASEEAGLRNWAAAVFGFVYIDMDSARAYIDSELMPNHIAIAFDEPLIAENEDEVIRALRRASILDTTDFDFDTAVGQLERNEVIAQALGDFIVVLGLGSLLIGGVGIMNTMLVLVRRRTIEIAAMKTFGLKGGQVARLFLMEGMLLGLVGSTLGSILGLLLGGLVNFYGERFINEPLVWRVHPEAILYGFVLGMATTIIFGLVPIATAIEIRPGIILRPNEMHVARLGIFRTLILMIIITLLLGAIVGQIVSPTFGIVSTFVSSFNFSTPYVLGIIGVAVTLTILGLLACLLWVVVWIIGKLPAFGIVDLRLALRNLSTQRMRTATTLLALSAGMFTLSGIVFVGEGTRELLRIQLTQRLGGNVLAVPVLFGSSDTLLDLAERGINSALVDVEGIESQTSFGNVRGELWSVDGVSFRRSSRELREMDGLPDLAALAPYQWDNLLQGESDSPAVYDQILEIVAGRNLSPADAGELVMVAPVETAAYLGAEVGSQVRYRLARQYVTYEIVGLYSTGFELFGGNPVVPPDSTAGLLPRFQVYTFNVEDEYIEQVIDELSQVRVPPIIAFDVEFFDTLLSRLLDQFTALPTLVGLLSLFTAAIIMANTIALSTLERRRQIGILKSIGLKSRRVLTIMLIESTIIGLLSAFLGIGMAMLIINIFTEFTGTFIPLPRSAQMVAILLVVISVLIGWVSTFLSANVAVRERVMNVLRYE